MPGYGDAGLDFVANNFDIVPDAFVGVQSVYVYEIDFLFKCAVFFDKSVN